MRKLVTGQCAHHKSAFISVKHTTARKITSLAAGAIIFNCNLWLCLFLRARFWWFFISLASLGSIFGLTCGVYVKFSSFHDGYAHIFCCFLVTPVLLLSRDIRRFHFLYHGYFPSNFINSLFWWELIKFKFYFKNLFWVSDHFERKMYQLYNEKLPIENRSEK